ncbi:putative required for excision 1-B domain-containing protein, partial [Cocos nucifera]|nr:putative required for excision 1-B domain-containing protein [Cocos nucifera]
QKTARIQILKKAGRPSERLVSHEHCRFDKPQQHECVHVRKITEAAGTEDAEADAEYDGALKEAIRGVQDAVTSINEHLEEVRYEIEALESV